MYALWMQKLTFDDCAMSGLPIVVSTFTGLTSLSLRHTKDLDDPPQWLAALTGGLRALPCSALCELVGSVSPSRQLRE